MGPSWGHTWAMKTAKAAPEKLNLRLPADLKQQVQEYAASQGMSVNTAINLAIRNFLPFAIKNAKSLRMAQPSPAPAARPTDNSSTFPKVGANQPCPCGSGKKAKHCHQKP
jgi:uncharacterized protein YecA (UPF0149 family)